MRESHFPIVCIISLVIFFGAQLRESTIEGGSRRFRGAVDAPSNIGRLAVLLASWPTKGRERAQSYDMKKNRRGTHLPYPRPQPNRYISYCAVTRTFARHCIEA